MSMRFVMRARVVTVALLVVMAGCASKPSPGGGGAAPVRVDLAVVRQAQVLSRVEAGGVVRARETALIASRVLAPVVNVRVRSGDRVRRGTELVLLDGRDVSAGAAQAASSLKSAEESVHAAEADVESATSALTLARATHDRVAALYTRRSATAEELDRVVAARAAAEGQAAAARARRDAVMEAREAARAAADAARISQSYTTLSAPFDGVVTERHVDPGSMAAPGVPLLALEDTSSYRLDVQVDESRVNSAQPGSTVEVQCTGCNQASWIAAIVTEVSRVDPSSHGFVVKIDLPPNARWRSGMFGRVRMPGAARSAVMAPEAALVRRGQLTFVFLLDQQRVRLRPISIGTPSGDGIEVLAGVKPGDRIVVNPPPDLADGTPVLGGSR
jgi:RND family efflux transporter MFP subunit